MTTSINDLIRAALNDAEEASPKVHEKTAAAKAPAVAPAASGPSEHEKIAAALEFIGRRGVGSFVKTSAHEPGHGNVGTDAGKAQPKNVPKVVPHNKESPPMSAGGQPETNAASPAGGGATQKALGGMGTGTHHPALASNKAAQDADKTVKGKHEAPQLKAVLDAATDQNIHKAASAHDPALVKAALAKKIAERAGAAAAAGGQ